MGTLALQHLVHARFERVKLVAALGHLLAQTSSQELVARCGKITLEADVTAESAHSRATQGQHDLHIHDKLCRRARDHFRDLVAWTAPTEFGKGGEKLIMTGATRE